MAVGVVGLVALLIVLGCLVGLVWLWVRVLRYPKQGMATCGQCGYIVEGLSTLTCPECGGDFRRVGIDTPKQRGAVRPIAFILLWTLLLPLPALIASIPLAWVAPRITTGDIEIGLANPRSAAYSRMWIRLDCTKRGGGGFGTTLSSSSVQPGVMSTVVFRSTPSFSVDTITLELDPLPGTGGNRSIKIDPGTLGFSYVNKAAKRVASSSGLDNQVLLTWFADCGVDVTHPDVEDEVAELIAIVDALRTAQRRIDFSTLTATRVTTQTLYDGPVPWVAFALPAFWLLVYISGIVLYLRIQARRHRHAEALAAASNAAAPV